MASRQATPSCRVTPLLKNVCHITGDLHLAVRANKRLRGYYISDSRLSSHFSGTQKTGRLRVRTHRAKIRTRRSLVGLPCHRVGGLTLTVTTFALEGNLVALTYLKRAQDSDMCQSVSIDNHVQGMGLPLDCVRS